MPYIRTDHDGAFGNLIASARSLNPLPWKIHCTHAMLQLYFPREWCKTQRDMRRNLHTSQNVRVLPRFASAPTKPAMTPSAPSSMFRKRTKNKSETPPAPGACTYSSCNSSQARARMSGSSIGSIGGSSSIPPPPCARGGARGCTNAANQGNARSSPSTRPCECGL